MIQEHYQTIAEAISNQLQIETPNHHVTSGTSRELIWLDVFASIVPKKFQLAQSVFLIDSFGQVSAEIDIAIYDEQYTPYVFNYGNMKFIPIEAVAVAIQSKSHNVDTDNVTAWASTIDKLMPVLNSYTRTKHELSDTKVHYKEQTQTATRPILILCTLANLSTNKKADFTRSFDFILHPDKENKLQVLVTDERDMANWYRELNHYHLELYNASYNELSSYQPKSTSERTLKGLIIMDKKTNKNPLLTFNMQLNQLLMVINNPIFFPHESYAQMFNEALEIQEKKDEVNIMKKSNHHYLLAIYDITGIQDYIFASNRMKENMGGSYIVGKMVEEYFVEVLKKCAEKYKVETEWKSNNNTANDVRIFADKNLQAEIIYIGGGNALVIYRDWELYTQANRAFALKVLQESASLTLATEAIPFTLETNKHYAQLYFEELMPKLAKTKAEQIRTKLNQTLPIFAQEPFKGDPITHEIDKSPLSTEQWLKRKATEGKSYLKDFNNTFVTETEDLKKNKGEDSYIGVVHIDGNGMGDWLKRELKGAGKNLDMEEVFKKHRELSLRITGVFRKTFEETVNHFNKQSKKFPMRPLILDGDDVTFICQGDLAIPFTLAFLKQLEKEEGQIRACAGVAFVHSHFPFELAYDIAEQCCQNAKKSYYSNYKSTTSSYFDFYLVRGSYVKQMEEKRASQPYLTDKIYDVKELKALWNLIEDLNHAENRWPRSRLIALYKAYLQADEIAKADRSREDAGTAVRLVKDEAESRGYQNIDADERMLFDALQLIDFGKDKEWTL
ncbi:DUF6602 domain-containing protein [Pseudogracilibacillus sp. SO30301A]|uniref:DUF6602 domain-containing protein n=1 Tax=Pseudogracilibacillus sp. SO30301A TaxID=3098291 RepID=UPI00300E608E